jgi:hypothetical protein
MPVVSLHHLPLLMCASGFYASVTAPSVIKIQYAFKTPEFQYLRHLTIYKIVKLLLCLIKYHVLKTCEGVNAELQTFLSLVADLGKWLSPRCCSFIRGERAPSTPRIGSWIISRSGLDVVKKRDFPVPAGNRALVVQRVVTVVTIPAILESCIENLSMFKTLLEFWPKNLPKLIDISKREARHWSTPYKMEKWPYLMLKIKRSLIIQLCFVRMDWLVLRLFIRVVSAAEVIECNGMVFISGE